MKHTLYRLLTKMALELFTIILDNMSTSDSVN
jgi:hypothetical protein